MIWILILSHIFHTFWCFLAYGIRASLYISLNLRFIQTKRTRATKLTNRSSKRIFFLLYFLFFILIKCAYAKRVYFTIVRISYSKQINGWVQMQQSERKENKFLTKNIIIRSQLLIYLYCSSFRKLVTIRFPGIHTPFWKRRLGDLRLKSVYIRTV